MNIRALLGALLFFSPLMAFADEATFTADFSEHVRNNGTEFLTSPHPVGSNTSNAFRGVIRFPVSALPAGATVTKVELLLQMIEASGNSADLVKIGSYAGTGQEDAQPDTASVAYARAAVANPYKPATDEMRTVGAKVIDITAAAADAVAAMAAGKPFSIALQQVIETTTSLHYQGFAGATHATASQRPVLRFTYSLPPPNPCDTTPPAGQVLITEGFDAQGLAARGWYDNTTPVLSSTVVKEGASAAEFRFAPGATVPTQGAALRHKFPSSEQVTVSFWVRHTSNWVGSGQPYHPHLFSLVTDQDPDYVGPSITHLTTYIEENGNFPQMGMQDALNIDQTRRGQDLRTVTEARSVAGCNGPQVESIHATSCYDYGSAPGYTNVTEWRSATAALVPGTWQRVQATFKMNTIGADGKARADGLLRYVLDGVTLIERTQVVFRTGVRATEKFNQLVLAPYIGDGSPVDQTIYVDSLQVSTTEATGTNPPPPPPPDPNTPPPAGALLNENFNTATKGVFDFLHPNGAIVTTGCHSAGGCVAMTVGTANQRPVFLEEGPFNPRPVDDFYFSGWWKFPVGYTWDGAAGFDPFGWEHKMFIMNTNQGSVGRVLLNLRNAGSSPEIAVHFEALENLDGVSKRSGVLWPADGQWHQFEFLVHRAPDTTGRARVWLDGALVIDEHKATCGNPCGVVDYTQTGAFVNQGARVTETFYMDDIVMGTSRP